jgi:hypothetical protein
MGNVLTLNIAGLQLHLNCFVSHSTLSARPPSNDLIDQHLVRPDQLNTVACHIKEITSQ